MEHALWLVPLFALLAALYASAGMGGGSSYIALMLAGGVDPKAVPPVALALNLCVAPVALWRFHRRGHLSRRLALPFVAASVPAAYLGGSLGLGSSVLTVIFIPLLLAAAAATWISDGGRVEVGSRERNVGAAAAVGAGLGLLAGVTGIGGGVFLAPAILLLGWGSGQEAAAVAAVFVTLNSAAGLAAHAAGGNVSLTLLGPLAAGVALGGWAGAGFGSRPGRNRWVRGAMAGVLILVSLTLGWRLIDSTPGASVQVTQVTTAWDAGGWIP